VGFFRITPLNIVSKSILADLEMRVNQANLKEIINLLDSYPQDDLNNKKAGMI